MLMLPTLVGSWLDLLVMICGLLYLANGVCMREREREKDRDFHVEHEKNYTYPSS